MSKAMTMPTLRVGFLACALSLGTAASARADDLPNYDAQLDQRRDRGQSRLAGASEDVQPSRFSLRAQGAAPQGASPAEAARHHLVRHAELDGQPTGAAYAAELTDIHDTGRGGIIVRFRQRSAEGYEVVGSQMAVLMTRDLDVVAVSGRLYPRAGEALTEESRFSLGPQQAVAEALGDRYDSEVELESRDAPAGESAYTLAGSAGPSGMELVEPARAKAVLYPLDGELRPAY